MATSTTIFFFLILTYLAAEGLSYSILESSSLTRDQPRSPAVGVQSPSRWTTREVPGTVVLNSSPSNFLEVTAVE